MKKKKQTHEKTLTCLNKKGSKILKLIGDMFFMG